MTALEILSTPELLMQGAIIFCSSVSGWIVGSLLFRWAIRLIGRRQHIGPMETYAAARLRTMQERKTVGLPPIPETVQLRSEQKP